MTLDKEKHFWATYSPQRDPQFKTHASKINAQNALSTKSGTIYMLRKGAWQEYKRIKRENERSNTK